MAKRTLKGKHLLVTGASSGIGWALAKALARQGARLSLVARREDRLQALAHQLYAAHGTACAVLPADLAQPEACRQAVADARTALGPLDGIINNAGLTMHAGFHEARPEVLQHLMQVNFWAAAWVTQAAMPDLMARGGTVVGISSIAGFQGLPWRTGYTASKFALNGLLATLRLELMPYGGQVLVVSPGFVASEIRERSLQADGTPTGKSYRNEQKTLSAAYVARRTVQAMQAGRRHLVLSPEGQKTWWASKFIPGLLDRAVLRKFQREEGLLTNIKPAEQG